MLAVYLSPLYILVNAYIFWRLIQWLTACCGGFKRLPARIGAGIVYLFFATSLLVGFLLPAGGAQRFFKSVGNYWLGVLLYTVLVLAAVELIRLFAWLAGRRRRRGKQPAEENMEGKAHVSAPAPDRGRRAAAGGAAFAGGACVSGAGGEPWPCGWRGCRWLTELGCDGGVWASGTTCPVL